MECTGYIKRRKITPRCVSMDSDSQTSTKIDFVNYLPLEVSQLIFSYLNVNELGKCSIVSKTWRSAINCNALWKKCCLKHGLKANEDEKFKSDNETDLCTWGQIWRNFRTSSAYSWFTRGCKIEYEIDTGTRGEAMACDDESLIFRIGNKLTLRKINKINQPKHLINLPFPCEGYTSLKVDSKFRAVAISNKNIVLVYKFGDEGCKCFRGIAITSTYRIIQVRSSFRRFIATNFNSDGPTYMIVIFRDGYIWIKEDSHYCFKKYIVNLLTKKVVKKDHFDDTYVHKSFILNWSPTKIIVFTWAGRNVLTFSRRMYKASVNDHILAIFVSHHDRKSIKMMETWDLYTKKMLISKPAVHYSNMKIHPSQDILYLMKKNGNCITSLCPITGNMLWHVRVPNVRNLAYWSMDVICQRYLIIHGDPLFTRGNKNEMHVYDAETGQYLYKTVRPIGFMQYVSGNVIVSSLASKFYVRSFLEQE